MLNPYLRQDGIDPISPWKVTFWSRIGEKRWRVPGLLIQGRLRGNHGVGDLFHGQATVHSSPLNP